MWCPAGSGKVHPTAPVSVVDLAGPLACRVRPVPQPTRLDLGIDRVELVIGDQERVVLRPDLLTRGYIGVVGSAPRSLSRASDP
jgi:hypothetical protein